MRAGLLGGPTGDAVGNVQSAFSSLFLRDVPLDDESLGHVRKVEVIVQLRGGPDLAGFYSSVIRGRMLHEMRFPAILEIEFQIFQNSRLIAFDGEMRSEEHTSELQSLTNLVCRLLLEKKKIEPGRRTGRSSAPAPSRHG